MFQSCDEARENETSGNNKDGRRSEDITEGMARWLHKASVTEMMDARERTHISYYVIN